MKNRKKFISFRHGYKHTRLCALSSLWRIWVTTWQAAVRLNALSQQGGLCYRWDVCFCLFALWVPFSLLEVSLCQSAVFLVMCPLPWGSTFLKFSISSTLFLYPQLLEYKIQKVNRADRKASRGDVDMVCKKSLDSFCRPYPVLFFYYEH